MKCDCNGWGCSQKVDECCLDRICGQLINIIVLANCVIVLCGILLL